MVYVSNYDFISITDRTVKPVEPFLNSYVEKCLEYNSTINSTRRMHIILDSKYEKDDLNMVMDKPCQHLNISGRYELLTL